MKHVPKHNWPQLPGANASLLLLLSLLAVNGAAVWGILAARQSARAAALEDLRLHTTAQARALEAALATLRGELIFLTQTPPLGNGLEALDSPDPTTRRWTRRDVEGALLLFLETHPAVDHVVVRDAAGEHAIAAGRRQGAPVLLRSEEVPGSPGGTPGPLGPVREGAGSRFAALWKLGGTFADQGELVVLLDPGRLLAGAAPDFRGRLLLRPPAAGAGGGSAAPGDPTAGGRSGEHAGSRAADPAGNDGGTDAGEEISASVTDPLWTPAVAWTLVAGADTAALPRSFEALAGRYRRTVALNLTVIALTLLLGLVAFRQVRRAARLQAEAEHQARLRELEDQVRHSERLASVGRLAAGMAHEINNPLEGMANYLTLLEEDLRAGRPREALEMVGLVREGLSRAAGVTRKVLAFARPAPPRTEPVEPNVDLQEVLGGAVEFVRANPAFRPVELSLAAGSGPLPVAGNPTTLGQLFLNLLLNACQAQPAGGRVEVVPRVEGDRVVVAVADRGPGIPAEVAGRLFEPFVSTRDSTGLGLAVCHGIATEHGGRIRAANRPGGGATFEVELPLAVGGRR